MARERTPGIEHLIERQASRWSLERKIAGGEAERPAAPCVAFSRLPFSQGDEVAQRVAEALDYGLFGRDVMERLATQEGAAEKLVAGLEERVRSLIERYVIEIFRSQVATQDEALSQVLKVLGTIGRRGAAVIVGRGAPYVLPAEHTLRVLVVAPAAHRAARLGAARGLGSDEARQVLAVEDRTRAEFVRHHFRLQQNDAALYDLCVDSATIGVEGAVALVLEAFRRRFPDTRLP